MNQIIKHNKIIFLGLITTVIVLLIYVFISSISQKQIHEPIIDTTIQTVVTIVPVVSEDSTTLIPENINEPMLIVKPEPYIIPFESYALQNEDVVGWFRIAETSIDYPLVQGEDNQHYLDYNYKNEKSNSGAIYLDYRNAINIDDNHIAIYGHYMKDETMFGELHRYKDSTFFNEHPSIFIDGLYESKHYEIFSVQIVSAYTYYLMLNLEGDIFKEYVNDLYHASIHDKEVVFPEELKILTLVTCTYEFDNARLLIHAYEK